jgi:hypothetical protein
MSVCAFVCLYVCVCVCVSSYTFPHFPTDPPQTWMEHYIGHETYHGLFMRCVHATREPNFLYHKVSEVMCTFSR